MHATQIESIEQLRFGEGDCRIKCRDVVAFVLAGFECFVYFGYFAAWRKFWDRLRH